MLDRSYFPQFGRVAVIDDNRNEVEGLMTFLSINAIPYIYLESVPANFCKLSCNGFRIVFLDLVLAGANDEKSVKSLLYANLNGLLKENNGPCTIAVWSTKVEHYKQQLEEVLNEINCQACDVIYLDKTKYKDYDKELIIDFENHFVEEFKKSSLLQYISLWENETNHSMINITSQIMSALPKTSKDRGGHYASNLAYLSLGKLLKESDLNNYQKILSSYEGLNLLLIKESNLNLKNISDKAQEIIEVGNIDPKLPILKFNSLLCIGRPYPYDCPKNVYKINSIDHSLTKAFINSDVKSAENINIMIDITNKCSYVQNKVSDRGHQFLYGILFAKGKYLETKSFPFYLHIKTILYEDNEYEFYVLLNSIVTKFEEDFNIEDAIFSISDDVYNEIRTKLGNEYAKTGKPEF